MSDGAKHITIVGGGIIGLCAGYYLGKAGHRVTILERAAARRESCSEQNAGMIVPSHFTPLAAPGVISQGLRWMLSPTSPFYLRPRLNFDLWRWCWQFYRHSNRRHVENSRELLRDLSLESRRLTVELADELEVNLAQRGLLMLCQTQGGLDEEAEHAASANSLGIEAEVCAPARLRELDPEIETDACGGVWFTQDCHLDPGQLLAGLRRAIVCGGGEFVDAEALDLVHESGRVSAVVTDSHGTLDADHVVLAAGAWTPALARKLGLRLPMQAGKGYSLTLPHPKRLPQLCYLLKEGRVAVTPMGGQLRIAGTMEICGNDLSVNRARLRGIVDAFCAAFPEFEPGDFSGVDPWSGLRPCPPDGIPYLGPVPGFENAIIASGHSMLGLSLGPVSGRVIADLVKGVTPDPKLCPGRFSRRRKH